MRDYNGKSNRQSHYFSPNFRMIQLVVLVTLSVLVLCFGLAETRRGVFRSGYLEAIDWTVSERGSSNKSVASSGGHSGASTESLWVEATVVDVDAASPPPSGEGIVPIWLAIAAASGVQQTAKNSAVPNAGENMATAPQPSTPQDVWSIVCSTCSKAQVEGCLLSTSMDAPIRIYDPSAAIFQAADTYDCLVNTDGCCAADTDDGSWLKGQNNELKTT
jgi:hypothetical protein